MDIRLFDVLARAPARTAPSPRVPVHRARASRVSIEARSPSAPARTCDGADDDFVPHARRSAGLQRAKRVASSSFDGSVFALSARNEFAPARAFAAITSTAKPAVAAVSAGLTGSVRALCSTPRTVTPPQRAWMPPAWPVRSDVRRRCRGRNCHRRVINRDDAAREPSRLRRSRRARRLSRRSPVPRDGKPFARRRVTRSTLGASGAEIVASTLRFRARVRGASTSTPPAAAAARRSMPGASDQYNEQQQRRDLREASHQARPAFMSEYFARTGGDPAGRMNSDSRPARDGRYR